MIAWKHLHALQRELIIYNTSYEKRKTIHSLGISEIVSEIYPFKLLIFVYVIEFHLIEFNPLYELYGFQKSTPSSKISVHPFFCAFTFSTNLIPRNKKKTRIFNISITLQKAQGMQDFYKYRILLYRSAAYIALFLLRFRFVKIKISEVDRRRLRLKDN